MGRLARFVIPGIPHHVTQRGNGRQQAFLCDDDYALYRDLLRAHAAASCGVELGPHAQSCSSQLLRAGEDEPLSMALRRAETVGRPLGDDAFMAWIQAAVGRDAKPGKRGPARKDS